MHPFSVFGLRMRRSQIKTARSFKLAIRCRRLFKLAWCSKDNIDNNNNKKKQGPSGSKTCSKTIFRGPLVI